MRYLSIGVVIVTLIYGILKMKEASSLINFQWYKELAYEKKIKATTIIKENWKVSIILISINIGSGLVSISTFMGKTHTHDNIVSIFTIITSIVIFILLLTNCKKVKSSIEKFKLNN